MAYPYFNNYMPYPYGFPPNRGLVPNLLVPLISQMFNKETIDTPSYSRLFPETTQPVESNLRPVEVEPEVNLPTGVEPPLKSSPMSSNLNKSLTPLKDVVSPPLSYVFPTLVNSKITSGFGNRKSPLLGASTYHQGIDIGGKIGDPLRAAVAGTILEIGKNNLLGNYLKMLGEGGNTFTYGHANSFKAKKGQKVKAGDILGQLGNTGNSTGAHLHFSVSKNGRYFNPMNLYGVNYDK